MCIVTKLEEAKKEGAEGKQTCDDNKSWCVAVKHEGEPLGLRERFEQSYGWLKDTVAPVPCCRVISNHLMLEAMKSKVRRVVLAYGEAKACQGLWFPVVSSRGRHKWLQPLWLLLWRNLKVWLHMLRVNTGPSALSLTHNWAELTQKHFTMLYSEIDRSLRETRDGYMAITQLQWPVALSRAVLVAVIAHNSTCQRWGQPCFYWNNLSVRRATHFHCPQTCNGVWHQMLFVILSAIRKKKEEEEEEEQKGGWGGGAVFFFF